MNLKKGQAALLALAAVMLLSMLAYKLNTPEKQVDRFLEKHSAQAEELLSAGQPLPQDLPQPDYRQGSHDMYEFPVTTLGGTHYGCYYSPDDVPLPYRNADLDLVNDVRGGWSWRDTEDRYGYTEQLAPCWYYFEATF